MPQLTYSDPRETASRRFGEVDSLRAIACALVIIYHTIGFFDGIASNSYGLSVFSRGLGVLGVLLFFAISGYVVPSSLRGTRVRGVKKFAIRRFFRLWPTFWLSLILIFLADYNQFSVRQLLVGGTMFPSLFGVSAIGGHFWTLEVELIFYIIVALLFGVFRTLCRTIVVPAYLIIIVWCLSWDSPPEKQGYWIRLPIFLSIMFYGTCCRELMKENLSFIHKKTSYYRASMIGFVTAIVSTWPIQGIYFGFIENDFYQVKAGFVMLASILGFLFWVLFFRMQIEWLSRVGRWTYSAYLFHWLILYSILSKFSAYLRGWPLPLYIVLVLGISFGVGAIAYRWIEQPSDRLGRRFSEI